MRISAAQRAENENRIRAAMDRLLRGEIQPGGRCDVKTLALESGSTAPPSTAAGPTRDYARNSRRSWPPLSSTATTPTRATPRSAS
jgi:hypothetical protein